MKRPTHWISVLLVIAALPVTCSQLAVEPPAQNVARKSVLDMHVHAADIGSGGSGSFLSAQLRNGYRSGWYLRAFGTSPKELERDGDAVVIRRIAEHVAASASTSKAMVLALDGVIDAAASWIACRRRFMSPTISSPRRRAAMTTCSSAPT